MEIKQKKKNGKLKREVKKKANLCRIFGIDKVLMLPLSVFDITSFIAVLWPRFGRLEHKLANTLSNYFVLYFISFLYFFVLCLLLFGTFSFMFPLNSHKTWNKIYEVINKSVQIRDLSRLVINIKKKGKIVFKRVMYRVCTCNVVFSLWLLACGSLV